MKKKLSDSSFFSFSRFLREYFFQLYFCFLFSIPSSLFCFKSYEFWCVFWLILIIFFVSNIEIIFAKVGKLFSSIVFGWRESDKFWKKGGVEVNLFVCFFTTICNYRGTLNALKMNELFYTQKKWERRKFKEDLMW